MPGIWTSRGSSSTARPGGVAADGVLYVTNGPGGCPRVRQQSPHWQPAQTLQAAEKEAKHERDRRQCNPQMVRSDP